MPILDRRIEFDERSRDFPIRNLVVDKPRRSYTWRVGVSLDQNGFGSCVGFGWAHELAARPKVHPMTNDLAFGIYHLAQTLDAWEGNSYEGTSVLAGAKAVQSQGFIGEYRWAFGENDLALAVGYKGPAVLGVNWRTGMDNLTIDAAGRRWAHAEGDIRGGHCFIVHGYNVPLNAYKAWNSWGAPSEFYISAPDMVLLLADQGEACVPVVRL